MSLPSIFNNMPAHLKALIDTIDPVDNLAGNSFGTNRRLSMRGGVFREIVNGKEVSAFEGRAINIVVLNAAPLSRTFYKDKWKEGAEPVAPSCWSVDCKTPDPLVKEHNRQAINCSECPQNIKGSGDGETRACRFQQRVAVLLDGEIESQQVYQLTLPATSIFGDDKNKMSMQAYARYLQAHKTPPVAIVTEARLDTDQSTPKLIFKAVRPLEEAELRTAIEMQKHPDTIKAITMTVSEMDGVEDNKPAAPEVKATPTKPVEKVVEAVVEKAAPPTATRRAPNRKVTTTDAPIPEPTVVQNKKETAVVEPKADLASILNSWDDE